MGRLSGFSSAGVSDMEDGRGVPVDANGGVGIRSWCNAGSMKEVFFGLDDIAGEPMYNELVDA